MINVQHVSTMIKIIASVVTISSIEILLDRIVIVRQTIMKELEIIIMYATPVIILAKLVQVRKVMNV